jgi:hypothetical protein
MTARGHAAARAQLAHEKALEVIQKYGDEQTKERLAGMTSGAGGTGLRNPSRDPHHALVLHAELIGALAEIVDELASDKGGRKRPTK